ncbi:MAG: 16S rRNA (cytosine(1402)-N(4))-methyltransferase RsmH [Muribaculaceae bacterium]|nr:16S rRNA (cytosine(1402)-N(4))-methyltransferase RsmH [Muribaculaceae bacterium]
MNQDVYHIPALLPQSLEALDVQPQGIYIDATLGGGGHSRAIVERLEGAGHLYSIDQDSDAIARATPSEHFTPVHGNFRWLANYCDYFGITGRVDGILADLGVSSHHFDDASRGFSFRADGPLDMRMNPQARHTAADLVANADADTLTQIFKTYGELKQARRLAAAIIAERQKSPVDTTGRLVAIASRLINPAREKKELAQVFQALRIAVNGEMDALETFLKQSVDVLRPGGRLAVITYHSLEDRMVKNFMRSGRLDGELEKDIFGRTSSPVRPLGSKAIVPDEDEVTRNPRSRSAKLRVCVKLPDNS